MRKFLLLIAFLWLIPVRTSAASEFHTKYVVDYKFDSKGQSQITQNISLTNLVSQVYASQYQFVVQGYSVEGITGTDAKGPLKITKESQGTDTTLVTIVFNDQVVGKGQTQNFTLNYQGSPARHNGQIWEVVLPGIGKPEFIDEYTLNLQVSPELGKLAFITPQPQSSNEYNYSFDKNQLSKVGVVAAFGKFQTFGFNLRYKLENDQNKPVYTEIALPQDTNYQRVFYDSIDPKPINVRTDADGNWLARYDLKPQEKLTVVALGQAHLLAEPVKLFSDLAQKPDLHKYLKATQYWPADDPELNKLGKSLGTPEAIYDYVVKTLSYDLEQAKAVNRERKGGKQAFFTPNQSVCTEFTDLFITLARAAGIPTREVNGYAYTNDATLRPLSLVGDVLHAWPQYWNPKLETWISIDPTWGNTTGGVDYFSKLDFNHFAFAIHGIEDSSPVAVGLYKTSETQKNVEIEFATYKEYPVQNIVLSWIKPFQIVPLIETNSYLRLDNNQGQAVYHRDININPKNFILKSSPFSQIVIMPPFSHLDLPITFARGQYLNFSHQSFQVLLNEQSMTYNVDSRLYLAWHIGVGIIASLIIVGLAFAAGSAGSVYFQKPKRGDNIRGQGQGPAK